MKRMLFALTALAMLLPAASPAAPGPNDLIVTAGAARYSLSGGHSALLMLDDASRALFVQTLGLDDPARAALWGRLMTGAVQTRREHGDRADTLWFNAPSTAASWCTGRVPTAGGGRTPSNRSRARPCAASRG